MQAIKQIIEAQCVRPDKEVAEEAVSRTGCFTKASTAEEGARTGENGA